MLAARRQQQLQQEAQQQQQHQPSPYLVDAVDGTEATALMTEQDPDLKFAYEEESDPERFFVPYIWEVIVARTRCVCVCLDEYVS